MASKLIAISGGLDSIIGLKDSKIDPKHFAITIMQDLI